MAATHGSWLTRPIRGEYADRPRSRIDDRERTAQRTEQTS
jgi:hypothetical protein